MNQKRRNYRLSDCLITPIYEFRKPTFSSPAARWGFVLLDIKIRLEIHIVQVITAECLLCVEISKRQQKEHEDNHGHVSN